MSMKETEKFSYNGEQLLCVLSWWNPHHLDYKTLVHSLSLFLRHMRYSHTQTDKTNPLGANHFVLITKLQRHLQHIDTFIRSKTGKFPLWVWYSTKTDYMVFYKNWVHWVLHWNYHSHIVIANCLNYYERHRTDFKVPWPNFKNNFTLLNASSIFYNNSVLQMHRITNPATN